MGLVIKSPHCGVDIKATLVFSFSSLHRADAKATLVFINSKMLITKFGLHTHHQELPIGCRVTVSDWLKYHTKPWAVQQLNKDDIYHASWTNLL